MRFIGPVSNGVKVIAALHQRIYRIVNSDEADTFLGEVDLNQVGYVD